MYTQKTGREPIASAERECNKSQEEVDVATHAIFTKDVGRCGVEKEGYCMVIGAFVWARTSFNHFNLFKLFWVFSENNRLMNDEW